MAIMPMAPNLFRKIVFLELVPHKKLREEQLRIVNLLHIICAPGS